MSANLPYEISKFQEHVRLLKQIKRDTKCAFKDICDSGQYSEEVLSTFLPEDKFQSLDSICEKPPTIIVVGQTCFAKVCVINELLGEPVLPAVEDLEGGTSWRMIRIKYGNISNVSLVLPDSFELAAALNAYEGCWQCVPRGDLELRDDEKDDPALASAVAEVSLNHALLKAGAQLVCSPSNDEGDADHIFSACCEDVLPILVYAVEYDILSEKDQEELLQVKALAPDLPIFFVKCSRKTPQLTDSMTEYAQHEAVREFTEAKTKIFEQLCRIGYLTTDSADEKKELSKDNTDSRSSKVILESVKPKSTLIENFSLFPCFLLFVRQVLQYHLVDAATVINDAHCRALSLFIATAFDMARDMIITPRRLEYAKEKEEELFRALMETASQKQEEIKGVIHNTICNLSPQILKEVESLDLKGIDVSGEHELLNLKDLDNCTGQIQELVLGRINKAVAGNMISSVEYLRESFVGTLQRCIDSLEKMDNDPRRNGEDSATAALKHVIDAAYQVEVTVRASSSLARLLWEKMKQALQTLPGKAPPKVDGAWKQKVAQDMLTSLSETRLARHICSQFKMRLVKSHDSFTTCMRELETNHTGRLERTEEQRMRVRKSHAPKLARLALESMSLRDVVLYGMPQLSREVGRGQYGVVYACDRWAGHHPCAIKSVVPPDDKHWNDLALEFFYTRSLPHHDRLVSIIGSVIDYSYGGGSSPAVLLVMDRLQRDLYQGIKTGLSFRARMQVAVDVVEGIRFLHSQGLVHRDIKLKNVLLDSKNRGKITDLGFCKPEAMMSGSIVGTPIHMAPELFSGHYDNSVDVYALGILFWYICAGTVRLPLAFEQCASKDHLWNAVRRGVRPERLANFDEECWQLMESCWCGDPSGRPLLGDIQPKLLSLLHRAEAKSSSAAKARRAEMARKDLK